MKKAFILIGLLALSACAAIPVVPVAVGAAGAVMIDEGMEQQSGGDGLF